MGKSSKKCEDTRSDKVEPVEMTIALIKGGGTLIWKQYGIIWLVKNSIINNQK